MSEKSKDQRNAEQPKLTKDQPVLNTAPPKTSPMLLELVKEHPKEKLEREFSQFADKVSGRGGKKYVADKETIGRHVVHYLKFYTPREVSLYMHAIEFLAEKRAVALSLYHDFADMLDSGATLNDAITYAKDFIKNCSEEELKRWEDYRNAIQIRWRRSGKIWPPSIETI